ncbi:MAG: hypothetical protein JO144_09120, partial [Actinobacteria bacterium]|nr:hypothetical protein [Actinomycetota bacterium]
GPTPGRAARGRLAVLFGAVLVSAASFGALEVCLSVSQQAAGHSAARAGLFLALLALGSAVGGLGYGLASRPARRFARYSWTLVGLATALALVAASLGQPALPVAMVLAGLPFAAAATEEFGLAQELSTPRQVARVTGLLLSAYGGGEALGVLGAGLLVGPVGERGLLLVAAAAVLGAAGLVAVRR